MNIDYMSPADAANLPLEAHSVDLHVSHTVLEHIPSDVLLAILAEARRILRPGGLLIHNVDPSDHFAHDDDTITRINFLQFADSEWKALAGNQFMYHNRLRAPDYVRLFEENGVRILRDERSIDERSKAALLSGFPVDARFGSLTHDDLATTTISLMGRFS
jgi:SAM-dependent methyltransferase